MSDDDNAVEVVDGKDLRDRKTGSLTVERGASYSVANREYLYDNDTQVRILFAEFTDERKVRQ